jgi:hypothetical protein
MHFLASAESWNSTGASKFNDANTYVVFSRDRRAAASQPSSLAVSEPQTLILELPFQDAVLLAEVFDDLVLLGLDPADECQDEEVPGNHASSLRHCGAVFGHEAFLRLRAPFA